MEAARPYDLGSGVATYVAELGPKLGYRSVVQANLAFDMAEAIPHYMTQVPAAIWRRVHGPGPAIGNIRKGRMVARQLGYTAIDVDRITPTDQTSTCWGSVGGDLDVETVTVCLLCGPDATLPSTHRRMLDAMGAHLGAALRLRRALRGAGPTGDDATTDAVVSPAGKVLDARAPIARQSLAALVEAVRRTERARLRRTSAEERLALWTALFEGRWSIVETVERDGKRTLLACRNEPETAALRRLTALEGAVAQYAALGHSYKYVAYELGISVSGVAAHLGRALRKLGLRTRAELIRVLGGGQPVGKPLPADLVSGAGAA